MYCIQTLLKPPSRTFLPQKWVRPAPETGEARDASSHPGECMDFNEADPLLLVENVSQTVVAPRRRGVE